jgi:nitroimidazol reductase NimA-like FMN-containing flavoprotein (pyridoxamine 5'-phosphate oxidase superfamily)
VVTRADLDLRECRELLGGAEIGRVAFCTPRGPEILPVTYVVDGTSLVFRTTPYGVLGTHAARERIAVEVDSYDTTTRTGWSVVARGRVRVIEDPDELGVLRAFRDPQPWAPGVRLLYVRLAWDELTGRRVTGSG